MIGRIFGLLRWVVFIIPSVLVMALLFFGDEIDKLPENGFTRPLVEAKNRIETQLMHSSLKAVKKAVGKVSPDADPTLNRMFESMTAKAGGDQAAPVLPIVRTKDSSGGTLIELAKKLKADGLVYEGGIKKDEYQGMSAEAREKRRKELAEKFIEMQSQYRERFEAEQAERERVQGDRVQESVQPDTMIQLYTGELVIGKVRMVSESRGEVHVDVPGQGRIVLGKEDIESMKEIL